MLILLKYWTCCLIKWDLFNRKAFHLTEGRLRAQSRTAQCLGMQSSPGGYWAAPGGSVGKEGIHYPRTP